MLIRCSEDDCIANELERFRQRQKAAEDRARLERADAEYARQLQSQLSAQISSGTPDPLSSRPSAWDRILGRQTPNSSQPTSMGPALVQSSPQGIQSGSNSISAVGFDTNFMLPKMIGGPQEAGLDLDVEGIPVITLGEDDFQCPSSYLGISHYGQANPYAVPVHTYSQTQWQGYNTGNISQPFKLKHNIHSSF
jgi:hypothetical protein